MSQVAALFRSSPWPVAGLLGTAAVAAVALMGVAAAVRGELQHPIVIGAGADGCGLGGCGEAGCGAGGCDAAGCGAGGCDELGAVRGGGVGCVEAQAE